MQETQVQSLGWEDPRRREWLPAPEFWPGEFHGLYSPWGHKGSDTTEQLSLSTSTFKGCKTHTICPITKKGAKLEVNNENPSIF